MEKIAAKISENDLAKRKVIRRFELCPLVLMQFLAK
jgi:hypothetical protein